MASLLRPRRRAMCFFQPRISILGVLLLIVSLLGVGSAQARSPKPPATWILSFDDEFRGGALDASKWTASRGPMDSLDGPIQYFLPDEVSVSSGVLTIRSEQRRAGGCDYTSGDISTLNKFAQRYGRFIVRCRFPRLAGTWSAAYLLPASGRWPPEIDITEYIGCEPETVFLTNHWRDLFGHQMEHHNHSDPSADWSDWHVYEADWAPGVVAWSIDGRPMGEARTGVSDVPMYLRLNTAIGGDFARDPAPSGWPQIFQVDYVRVYRRQGDPPPVLGGHTPFPVTAPAPPAASAFSTDMPTGNVFPPASPTGTGWVPTDGWLLFGLLGLWAVTARAAPDRPRLTRTLALAVVASSVWYLLWRGPMIAWAGWWVALPLFAAEVFGILQVWGFQYTVWPRPDPFTETRQGGKPPSAVFILIPTVDEGRDVVEPTVRGVLATRARFLEDSPDSAVTIAICNDGRVAGYPGWREVEDMADALGVVCLTRAEGGGAKAGNLESARQALGATGDALVVIFDADMVAERDFLVATVPPFADPQLGWVQTGQYYRNQDNPIVRWAHDQQMVFFQTLCPGKARMNACFICGTNVVIRAQALDEIGGLPQDSVTEDFAASVRLYPRWRSRYLSGVLATGLGPADLPSYFAQQRRWATGTLGVLRRQWRQLFLGGPKAGRPAQRVQYALSATHYLSGTCHGVFFLAPLLSLLLGVPALRPVGGPELLRHFGPYLLTSQLAFWYACGRHLRWRGAVLGFGSAPVLIAALFSVLRGKPGRFVVTAKRRRGVISRRIVLPHRIGVAIGLLALAAALAAGLGRVWVSAFWVGYALLMLGAVLRLAAADRAAAVCAAMPATEIPPPAFADYVARRRGVRQNGGD